VALVVCKVCKKAFISASPNEGACPACSAKMKEVYSLVHNFLRDNERKAFSVREVSRILGIDADSIKSLAALGMIQFGGSAMGGGLFDSDSPRDAAPAGGGGAMHIYDKKQR
jgi:hypothetical protein